MATLNINGKRVKVDDSFLSLSPEQQNATVDEIAASLGGDDAASHPAFAAASNASQALGGKVADLPSRQKPPADLMNSTAATANGLVNGIPILGPLAQNLSDAIGGTVAQVSTGDLGPILTPDKHKDSTAYRDYVSDQQAKRAGYARSAPLASLSGNLTTGIGSMILTGGSSAGAEALGVTSKLANPLANLGQRVINSGLSTLGIGTADSMVRGEKPTDALMENLTPAGIAAALPIGGAAIRATGRGVRDNFIRPLATAANRENEVTRRLSGAIRQDIASGARMTQGTERVAADAGADVLNADRFGSAIRTLARTASNVSPQADNIFRQATEQRFVTQGNRAVNFVRRLMSGATDDLALQDQLRTAARTTNKAAYDKAYSAPNAKAIWSPKIRQLLASDDFKTALREADKVAANDAAITGRPAIRNPFTFDADGNVTGLRQLSGGGNALPNLEYWDIVQRTLRTKADEAAAGGKRLLASQIRDMRSGLLSELDSAVPQFKQARQGAAGFFGAEDAIDAGRKAVKTTKATPEIERAVAAMTPAEKDAFSVGFSSEIIDAISASRDRVNVINSIFGSQSARDRIRIALGPHRARELEAYVKMEQVLDQLRTATQGNSTTAKQLIQAGLMGGGAGGLGLLASNGDLTTGFSAASIAILGRRGLQMMGKHVDDQVMKRVAEVLSSSDPSQLQRAIQNASLSQAHMDAIEGIMRALASTSRGVVMGTGAAMAVN